MLAAVINRGRRPFPSWQSLLLGRQDGRNSYFAGATIQAFCLSGSLMNLRIAQVSLIATHLHRCVNILGTGVYYLSENAVNSTQSLQHNNTVYSSLMQLSEPPVPGMSGVMDGGAISFMWPAVYAKPLPLVCLFVPCGLYWCPMKLNAHQPLTCHLLLHISGKLHNSPPLLVASVFITTNGK